ncbi:MAG: histidine phosphatase family protein [Chlorobiaceae bacterium]
MKTIYLVRHAKSGWDSANTSDFDRPLSDRGRKSAPRMAELLKGMGVLPEMIISSPAKRAITTAEIFSRALDYPEESILSLLEVYHGGTDDLLAVVRKIPAGCATAMLFGHNPTITDFAGLLAGKMMATMDPCGIARIDMDIDSWEDAGSAKGRLVWHDSPKES